MEKLVPILLGLSALGFVVGLVAKLLALGGGPEQILWGPLTWWRGAVYCVALAMALILHQRLQPARAA